ncbi:DUF2892 domain-containing protein [Candidatus Peregrinibacteria bacterium]|jgi:hypothetical protein|nr:DUF2892 domain-containing protein [Candidatus Peregrinibacteria bacterium]
MLIIKQKRWTIPRTIILLAGTFTFLSVILGTFISPNFFYFTAFVGIMQITFTLTGFCPTAILLRKMGLPLHCDG